MFDLNDQIQAENAIERLQEEITPPVPMGLRVFYVASAAIGPCLVAWALIESVL